MSARNAAACIVGLCCWTGLATNATPATRPRAGPTAAHGVLVQTGAMGVARSAHTATALVDGRVLVAGGFSDSESAAGGAELYDPALRRFSPLPRMITQRQSHTATLLPNRKVLIVGGYGAGTQPVASAELFDPATTSFAPTGSLASPRAGQVAVLLTDGRVLVAGGIGPGWTFLSSAEIYDPNTGRFSRTGSMTVARESHAAVRLQDGRVLIVGGHRGRHAGMTLYESAEAYDPRAGTFHPVGGMHVPRHKHDAVGLRDGRVLITGGADERDDQGVYDSTELFDPKSGTFALGPAMRRRRYKHQGSSVLLPDGKVLIAGGAPQAEVFDPLHNTFTLVGGDARMPGQFCAVAPLRAGGALITGGYGNGGGPRSTAWVYQP